MCIVRLASGHCCNLKGASPALLLPTCESVCVLMRCVRDFCSCLIAGVEKCEPGRPVKLVMNPITTVSRAYSYRLRVKAVIPKPENKLFKRLSCLSLN